MSQYPNTRRTDNAFYVAAPLILPPSTAQDITGTGETISADASLVLLTADGNYTLASTPTIASGADGQVLTIINCDDASTITLQDETGAAGSNLRLAGAASLALAPRDVVTLVYSSTLGDWIEISRSNN